MPLLQYSTVVTDLRFIEYPKLKETHMGHQVHLPAPHRPSKIQTLYLRAASKGSVSSGSSRLCPLL